MAIGKLERLVADWALENHKFLRNSGTNKRENRSGRFWSFWVNSCGDLSKLGYEVIIFEALHEAGGVLTYGIPEFRLPKKLLNKKLRVLKP